MPRRKDQYIESDNSYYEPSTDPSHGTMVLVVITTVLMVLLTSVLAIIYLQKQKKENTNVLSDATGSMDSNYIAVASPTPTPVLPMTENQNPLLYPAQAEVRIPLNVEVDKGSDVKGSDDNSRYVTQTIFTGNEIVSSFNRDPGIFMRDPLEYSSIAGITTYRGNNFRSSAAFGYCSNASDGTITQVWEFYGLGTRLSSDFFEWTGIRMTGQPLIVKWPANIKADLNLYPDKMSKSDLVEVIVAALDGNVYFFDLEDGTPTRDRINVGASIKGTPALDPRGYPLLYLGQTDDNSDLGFGMYIYSLIDGSRLYFYDGKDDNAYRMNWRGFDSSPVIDGDTDTLIWPCENGIIYTFKLNTKYITGAKSISVSPERTGYKYIFNDTTGAYLGVESSIAVYGNYGYFTDNSKNLVCLDLNTMEMRWALPLGDDTDITPVIDEEGGVPFVYVATEVDDQGGKGQYCGAAYTYKVNGLTGSVIWQTSQPCHTYNGETSDSDQTGGCFGNPIIGKKNISGLVIFSYSMTKDLVQGNRIVAYDKDTGTEVWRYDMNKYSYSSPVDIYDEAGNCYIVIADSIGQIHLIYANDMTDREGNFHSAGERVNYIQTSRLIGTPDETTNGIVIEASPAIYGNMMVVGTRSGSIFGIKIGG